LPGHCIGAIHRHFGKPFFIRQSPHGSRRRFRQPHGPQPAGHISDLGYWKPLSGPGNWLTRHYLGDHHYENETLAIADDYSDADGIAVLNFHEAQTLARSWMVDRANSAAGKTKPLTVSDAIKSYIDFLETNRKSGREGRYANAFILPALGKVEISALTTDQTGPGKRTSPRRRLASGGLGRI
jgi:hypothetical protein